MDSKAFFRLSCGLYIIAASDGERNVGCVINTTTQVTSSPSQLMVAVDEDNSTAESHPENEKIRCDGSDRRRPHGTDWGIRIPVL